jgi:hypothetical protein
MDANMENNKVDPLKALEAFHNWLDDIKVQIDQNSDIKFLHNLARQTRRHFTEYHEGRLFATLQANLRIAEDAIRTARNHVKYALDELKKDRNPL